MLFEIELLYIFLRFISFFVVFKGWDFSARGLSVIFVLGETYS